MALITNNISGSSSDNSKIGITGSVIISNSPASQFPTLGTDAVFFVSGSETAKAVLGGAAKISGSLSTDGNVTLGNSVDDTIVVSGTSTFQMPASFNAGLSGSLTKLTNGTSYLIAGSNVTITTGSTGAVTIASTSGTSIGGGANNVIYRNSSDVVTGSSGLNYDGVSIKVNGNLESVYQNGDEGGEIFLNKPVTNTSITNGVTVDVYQDKLRFFENGGTFRGYYIDITSGGSNASTNLVGGGGGGAPTGAQYVTLATNASLTDERVLTAGTGIALTDGGAGSTITAAINNAVVATVSGTTFTGAISAPGITSTAGLTQSGGNVSLAAQTNGSVSIGNDSGTTATAILGGTSVILSGAAGTNYTVGGETGTGTITIGQSNQTNTINIGNSSPSAARIQTINIGTNASTLSSAFVSIGSIAGISNTLLAAGSTLTLTGSTGTSYIIGGQGHVGTITLGRSTESNTISIGSAGNNAANTQTVNIGSGTGLSTITIGSTTGTSTTSIRAGTGGLNFSGASSFNNNVNVTGSIISSNLSSSDRVLITSGTTRTISQAAGMVWDSTNSYLGVGVASPARNVNVNSGIRLGTTNYIELVGVNASVSRLATGGSQATLECQPDFILPSTKTLGFNSSLGATKDAGFSRPAVGVISVSGSAPGAILRFNATATPTTAGDIAMNTSTGRPIAFIGGSALSLAHVNEIAPSTSSYVVMSLDSALPNDRVLAAGTGLTLTDSGAGGNATFAINDGVVATVSGTTFSGDIGVNGGDITTTASTFNLINASATTVNFAGAATNLNLGTLSGSNFVSGTLKQKTHVGFSNSELNTVTAACSTTTATAATIFTIPLTDEYAYWIEAAIVARQSGGGNRAYYTRNCLAYRTGGGSATVQMGVLSPITVESNSTWDATLTASGNNILVRVTGASATTIYWVATIRYQAISTDA